MALDPQRLTRRRMVYGIGLGSFGLLAACTAPPAPASAPKASSPPPAAPTAAATPAALSAAQKPMPSPAPTTAPAPTAAPKATTTRTPQPATMATIAGNSFNAYFMLGKDKGLFAQEGVDLTIQENESANLTPRAVLTGEALVGHFGVPAVFLAVAGGAPLKIIGTARGKLDLVFYGRGDIKQPQDVVGKAFGVGAPGGLIYQVTLAYFKDVGIDPSSVELINLGSGANIFKGLVGGKVDAAITNGIYQPTAREEGINIIAQMADRLPNYPFTLLHATDEDIAQRRSLLVDFLAGWARSIRYGLDHPDEVGEYMIKHLAKTEEEVKFELEFSKSAGIISPDLTITPEMVRFPQEVEVETGTMKEILPFERVATDELQKEMIARIGPYRKS